MTRLDVKLPRLILAYLSPSIVCLSIQNCSDSNNFDCTFELCSVIWHILATNIKTSEDQEIKVLYSATYSFVLIMLCEFCIHCSPICGTHLQIVHDPHELYSGHIPHCFDIIQAPGRRTRRSIYMCQASCY